ncbi:disintegrin and metalloproteinase domain-containing protein unc-71 isoform X3 [Lepeophtheirus salmonis]|uniref:disintegrin and metalloproteinase domain-containing protein unc-71 isoform X3 n=1 Tax=Lepeophtheirus salmonis TaxID=72036 RepID=UPI003AF3EF50
MRLLFIVILITFYCNFGSFSSEDSSNDLRDNVDYDWILDDETPRDEVERLLRDYEENRELVRNLGSRYYQVVYPIQMRNRGTYGVSTREIDIGYNNYGINKHSGEQKQHFRQTSLLIKAFQHKFRLDLTLNTRLLAPNMKQKEYMKDGAVSLSPQDVEHCYYHGTVKDFQGSDFIPGSMAALQTCNGVSGIVHLGNETFVIHPFYGGDLSSKHPHVIYEYNDRMPQGCAIGQSGTPLRSKRNIFSKENTTNNKFKRDIRNVAKFIETALVLDKAMFDKRPQSKRRDVIHDAIQVANIADLYFRNSLKSRLSIVYIESWQDTNQAAGFGRIRDINTALETFGSYVDKKLFQIDRDTTQLLTGQTYLHGRSTVATIGTICATKALGISVDINVFEPHILAANLAHAIGHNLGLHHDMELSGDPHGDCHCEHWHGCIMRPSVIGEEGIQPYRFSICSSNSFQSRLAKGAVRCLLNKPNQIQGFNSCGNGIVDDGETCDCGSPKSCRDQDPCCDPFTCQLKREAQCSSGPCCNEKCQLQPRGYPCRTANNECDLTEVCSGDTGSCPQDMFVKNAIPCGNNQGYCFNGNCPRLQMQCEALWGRKAKTADSSCFRLLNSRGSAEGNCGKDKYTGELKPCSEDNYNCGTLHCSQGSSKPLLKLLASEFTTHQKQERGKHFECKVVRGYLQGLSSTDVGMVEDGSKCGEDKICLNQTCINLRPLQSYTNCPSHPSTKRECSDHGTCSNINTCVCDNGYTGSDCSLSTRPFIPIFETTQSPGSRMSTPLFIDSGSTPSNTYILKESDSDTIIMVIFLVAAVGGVFILFALMALCYREHSLQQLKRMGNHGSGHHIGSTSMLPDGAYTSEKGILKKSYPLDLEDHHVNTGSARCLDALSSSSANQLMDSEVERTLKSLNGYHEGIIEALRTASSHRGSNASSSGGCPAPPPPPGSSSLGAHRSSAASLSEELRKQLINEGYVLDYGNNAPPNSSGNTTGGVLQDFANAMKAAASASNNLPPPSQNSNNNSNSNNTSSNNNSNNTNNNPNSNIPGPIRIRNLEDLIRQLEHSSRHMSPSSGSEDLRVQESESERHFRESQTHVRILEDPAFTPAIYIPPTSSNKRIHPTTPSSSQTIPTSKLDQPYNRDSRMCHRIEEDEVRISDLVLTPASTEMDSDDYAHHLRSTFLLQRSSCEDPEKPTKEEEEQDLSDDLDSIRSPFYKQRIPLTYPISPNHSEDESSFHEEVGGGTSHDDSEQEDGQRSFYGHHISATSPAAEYKH